MQVFFRPLNFKQACDDEGFPADLLVFDLRGHPPAQESHLVSDKEKEGITDELLKTHMQSYC